MDSHEFRREGVNHPRSAAKGTRGLRIFPPDPSGILHFLLGCLQVLQAFSAQFLISDSSFWRRVHYKFTGEDDVGEESMCILETGQFEFYVPASDAPAWINLSKYLPVEEQVP